MKEIDLHRIKAIVRRAVADGLAQNQRGVAEVLGYTESGLSQILNGKVPVSRSFIKKIYDLYPNINEEWLLNGVGEMFTTSVNGSGNVIQAGIVEGNNTQNADCAEQLKMALNEMAEQRKVNCAIIQKKDEQIDRLLSIIEKTK